MTRQTRYVVQAWVPPLFPMLIVFLVLCVRAFFNVKIAPKIA